MRITQEEYGQLAKKASPPTKAFRTIVGAFVIGGAFCLLGEALLELFAANGLSKMGAGAWTSILLVLLSAILTSQGWYEKLAKYAGAGTLVPITGFANAVVSSALEAKTEGFILGVGAKIFTIAGPVILYGTAASVIYGVIYWIMQNF
ncbi:MAG: SpoVA/SpoVAEb family sporulation membrane protein [Ruminococcus sp.]|nr:SpoVA/SpoVAEb family sporulation membrane protein [Ruminococcus sp.]MBQ8906226.1 SpoVA/SpoVAEb family sporulation membrane protein [Ruminococcus sp.]